MGPCATRGTAYSRNTRPPHGGSRKPSNATVEWSEQAALDQTKCNAPPMRRVGAAGNCKPRWRLIGSCTGAEAIPPNALAPQGASSRITPTSFCPSASLGTIHKFAARTTRVRRSGLGNPPKHHADFGLSAPLCDGLRVRSELIASPLAACRSGHRKPFCELRREATPRSRMRRGHDARVPRAEASRRIASCVAARTRPAATIPR
jgi:hypothetical protein